MSAFQQSYHHKDNCDDSYKVLDRFFYRDIVDHSKDCVVTVYAPNYGDTAEDLFNMYSEQCDPPMTFSNSENVPGRETHPFDTPVGLKGGVGGRGRYRRRNQGRRRGKRKKETQEQLYRSLEKTRVPKEFLGNVPVANLERKRMAFYEPNLNIVPGGVAFYVKDWRINSVYDPDPLIGGGTVSGFTQFSALWNIYRVDRFRFRYEMCSLETTVPLQFYFVYRDYQPSTNINTYALCQANVEVVGSSEAHILGVLNGNNIYRSGGKNRDTEAQWTQWINPGTFSGDPLLYRASAGFSGTGAANPSSVVWLGLVVMAEGSGGTIPNGFTIMVHMEFDVTWWSTVPTLPSLQKKIEQQDALTLKKDLEKLSLDNGGECRITRNFVREVKVHDRRSLSPSILKK